eukprot:TRINITY_DN3487_c0_g1_i2.p1 TRINITY_DN3487_c0_g1~~TRINITY_DN3487_c0_g1_i2.p1  ORF type:complete len:1224 (+),score=478.26 TRINITY_DN3487_c0_g1_i2:243-3914(+)
MSLSAPSKRRKATDADVNHSKNNNQSNGNSNDERLPTTSRGSMRTSEGGGRVGFSFFQNPFSRSKSMILSDKEKESLREASKSSKDQNNVGIFGQLQSLESVIKHNGNKGNDKETITKEKNSFKQLAKLLDKTEPGFFLEPIDDKSNAHFKGFDKFTFEESLQGDTVFHALVKEGLLGIIKAILNKWKDFNLNSYDGNGMTPLHLAAIHKQYEVLDFLLDQDRVATRIPSRTGELAIHYYVINEFSKEEQKKAFRSLKKMMLFTDMVNLPNADGKTALFLAVARGQEQVIRMLLNNGASFKTRDSKGETIFHVAARRGSIPIIHSICTHKKVAGKVPLNAMGDEGTCFDVAKDAKTIAHLHGIWNVQYIAVCHPAITEVIFRFLSVEEATKARFVCKVFSVTANSERFWRYQYTRIGAPPKNLVRESWRKEFIEARGKMLKEARKKEIFSQQMETFKEKFYDSNRVNWVQRIARKALQRRAISNIVKDAVMRKKLAQEIYETEKSYVNHLLIVINHFKTPLSVRLNSAGKPLVEPEDIKTIFSDIEVIHGINSLFLEAFEKKITSWSPLQVLSDVFSSFQVSLRMYTQYVNNYNRSIARIAELKKTNKEFDAWLNERESHKSLNFLDLSMFLIEPVQRIPRYQLLLENLVKKTWVEHPDRSALASALEKIKETAHYVNTKKREAEDVAKVTETESKLYGKGLEGWAGNDPSRRHIRDGELSSRSRKGTIKRIWLCLFTDTIVAAKLPKKGQKEGETKMEIKELCDLQYIELIANPDPYGGEHLFMLRFMKPKDQFRLFKAESKEQKEEWVLAIDGAMFQSALKNQRIEVVPHSPNYYATTGRAEGKNRLVLSPSFFKKSVKNINESNNNNSNEKESHGFHPVDSESSFDSFNNSFNNELYHDENHEKKLVMISDGRYDRTGDSAFFPDPSKSTRRSAIPQSFFANLKNSLSPSDDSGSEDEDKKAKKVAGRSLTISAPRSPVPRINIVSAKLFNAPDEGQQHSPKMKLLSSSAPNISLSHREIGTQTEDLITVERAEIEQLKYRIKLLEEQLDQSEEKLENSKRQSRLRHNSIAAPKEGRTPGMSTSLVTLPTENDEEYHSTPLSKTSSLDFKLQQVSEEAAVVQLEEEALMVGVNQVLTNLLSNNPPLMNNVTMQLRAEIRKSIGDRKKTEAMNGGGVVDKIGRYEQLIAQSNKKSAEPAPATPVTRRITTSAKLEMQYGEK